MCACSPASVSINKGDKVVPFCSLGAKRMTVWLNATLHAVMQRNTFMEPRKRQVCPSQGSSFSAGISVHGNALSLASVRAKKS